MKNPLATQEMVRRLARRRRWWRRIRRTLLVVCSVVVVCGLAYGVDRAVVAGHRLYVEDVEHHDGAVQPASTTPLPATTTSMPGAPPCTSPELTGYLDRWQIVGGTLYEIIVLTTASATPCALTGYPGLGVSGPGSVAPPAPVSQVATLGANPGVSTPTPVVLTTGSQAWFEESYSVACQLLLAPGAPATDAPNE